MRCLLNIIKIPVMLIVLAFIVQWGFLKHLYILLSGAYLIYILKQFTGLKREIEYIPIIAIAVVIFFTWYLLLR